MGSFFTVLVAHSSSAELNGIVVERSKGFISWPVQSLAKAVTMIRRHIMQVLLHVEECWKIPTLGTSY